MSGDEGSAGGLASRDLGRLERAFAAILGVIGTGVGGVGIFLSTNQAGTTAILLIGAAFLLMAVQGTAIVKIGKDSAELARRQAKELASKAVAEFEADRPEAGRAYANAAEIVARAPSSSAELEFATGYAWQDMVLSALRQEIQIQNMHTARFERTSSATSDYLDLVIRDEHTPGKRIAVRIVSDGVERWTHPTEVERFREEVKSRGLPLLLIMRHPPPRATVDSIERKQRGVPPIRAVGWNSSKDQNSLVSALNQLRAAS